MSVIECPVCDRPVNAEAIRCPACGADPRLPAAEARAELADRGRVPVFGQGPQLPGWSRRRRLLVAIPGLAVPLVVAAGGLAVFVWGWRFYFSLPPAQRGDGDPISPDAGMALGALLILAALFLAGLAAGATLPSRLDLGMGVTLLLAGLGVLGLVIWAVVSAPLGWWSLLTVPFVYVPALIVVRLWWQSSGGHSKPDGTRGKARVTSISSRLAE